MSVQSSIPSEPEAVTFVSGLQSKGTSHYIKNIDSTLEVIKIDSEFFPVTKNEEEYQNSYVCSPYTAYISYARDELGLIKSPIMQRVFRGTIWGASGLLKLSKINQTVSLNNWLFSTSLVPEWRPEVVEQFTKQLSASHPNHSLTIRSLNRITNPSLIDNLSAKGWKMMPARQVYLFSHEDISWWKRKNVQNDQRFLKKTPLERVLPNQHTSSDFKEMAACFHQLFIKKHSEYNPQYTQAYLEFLHSNKLVEFFSFRDESQQIVATIGLFTQQNTITAPIVGYKIDAPRNLGLYRLLMAQLLKITYERGQTLNLSSGAGDFKKQRGGIPTIEYTAIYSRHLPVIRRTLLSTFASLLMKYAPGVLQKNNI